MIEFTREVLLRHPNLHNNVYNCRNGINPLVILNPKRACSTTWVVRSNSLSYDLKMLLNLAVLKKIIHKVTISVITYVPNEVQDS